MTLIDSALTGNFDALAALQRIEAARADVQFNRGALFPTVGATAVPAIREFLELNQELKGVLL